MRWRKGRGGSNSLSVSGPETKRTNSRNMPRLIPIAESEAKLFSSETRDYYQWIRYCHRNHEIVLWWSCDYFSIKFGPRPHFSSALQYSQPFLVILHSWLEINAVFKVTPGAWVEAINAFIWWQIIFFFLPRFMTWPYYDVTFKSIPCFRPALCV